MNRFILITLTPALTGLGIAGPWASAAEVQGAVEPATGYLSADAYQYGNFSGVNEQGLEPFVNLNLQARSAADSGDTGYWQLQGERLGLRTPHISLEAGQQGSQRLRLDYRETPLYRFNDAQSPIGGIGSPALNLPQGWQVSDASTAGMSTLEENLVDVNLWQRRRSLELDYRRGLGEQWTLNADLRRDRVQGTRALGGVTGATGGNVRALLLPAPLDYETHLASVSLAYAGTALRWNLGYQGSFFNNGFSSLVWPTPFAQHPQWAAGTGHPGGVNQMAMEPDNQAHQLRVNGSYAFTGSTRLHVDTALGRQTQDQEFLPYTINPQLQASAALPMDSLNARVDTARIDLRLTSRPLPRLNLVTRLGHRDRDNKTPVAAYQRVRGDAVNQQSLADARLNRPYSLSITSASMDTAWRLSRSLRLEGGLEYTDTRRDYSEVKRSEEQGVKLGLRSTQLDTLALGLDYRHQQRRTDEYTGNRPLLETHLPGTIGAEDFENHPLLRKYYLSDRDRDQLRLNADWYPLTQLTLGAAVAWNQDDYPSGFFGLKRSQLLSTTLDITWAPNDELRLSGFYNRDRYRNRQTGRAFRGSVPADAFNPARDWQVMATDRFETVGLSLDREQMPLRLGDWQAAGELDLSVQLSHSRSGTDVDTRAGEALQNAPLPALATRLNTLSAAMRYHWSARSSLGFALERDVYRSSNFSLDNVAPDTLSGVLLLGQRSPHYKVTWLSMSYLFQY
ncbi:MAG: MtrB/PioB family decaheme-associated outer membrane protein [Pseudohongiellaceae bacterium]